MGGICSTHGRDEKCIQNFARYEGKKLLGRISHRWEDIRMDLGETGWEGVNWIHLTQDRDQWQYLRIW